VASRRLSAEVVLGSKGAIEPLSIELKRELKFAELSVLVGGTQCPTDKECFSESPSLVTLTMPIPFQDKGYQVVASVARNQVIDSLNFRLFILICIPLILIFVASLLWQRRYFKHAFVKPVQALADTSTGIDDIPSNWPIEIRTLANQMRNSMESRDQAIFGQIASGLIHDIKTLLQGVISAVDLVKEIPSEDTAKRAQRQDLLLRASERNLPKIQAIIELTMDGVREIRVKPVEQDILKTINSSRDSLADFITRSGVELQFLGASAIVPHDSVQLERVVSNLIKNSVEALSENPKSKGRILNVSVRREETSVSLVVEDSGPGFRKTPGSLFKPLRSTKDHGAGLGLFVSKKIIEAHSGSLSAGRSESLGGAKVTIQLPLPAVPA
jgi:signal transduction histidine kinase